MSDFAVAPTDYPRLSKLVLQALLDLVLRGQIFVEQKRGFRTTARPGGAR